MTEVSPQHATLSPEQSRQHPMTSLESHVARCSCGQVEIELSGEPIITAACYCDDCQAGGRMIEALPGAPQVKNADGGTDYLMYRKDRVRVARGAELLQPHKLTPGSPTNRVMATCCNTAVLVNFDRTLHWVSVYRSRFDGAAPAVEMRVQTKFAPEGVVLPPDIPAYRTAPLRFVWKLVMARIAMLFGR